MYSHIGSRIWTFINLDLIFPKKEKKAYSTFAKEALAVKNWVEELQYFPIQSAKRTSSKAFTAKLCFLNGSPLTLRFIVIDIVEEWLWGGSSSAVAKQGLPLILNTNKHELEQGFSTHLKAGVHGRCSGDVSLLHLSLLLPSLGQP